MTSDTPSMAPFKLIRCTSEYVHLSLAVASRSSRPSNLQRADAGASFARRLITLIEARPPNPHSCIDASSVTASPGPAAVKLGQQVGSSSLIHRNNPGQNTHSWVKRSDPTRPDIHTDTASGSAPVGPRPRPRRGPRLPGRKSQA